MRAFTLVLSEQTGAMIAPGIVVVKIENRLAIELPKIGSDPIKHHAAIEKSVKITDGKIQDLFFKLKNGTRFSDAKSFVTINAPYKADKNVVIMAPKRWPELKLDILTGRPNGFVPGAQILSPGDSICFNWNDHEYLLYNMAGEAYLSKITPAAAAPAKAAA